jgi:hypothetical protein
MQVFGAASEVSLLTTYRWNRFFPLGAEIGTPPRLTRDPGLNPGGTGGVFKINLLAVLLQLYEEDKYHFLDTLHCWFSAMMALAHGPRCLNSVLRVPRSLTE